MRRGIVAFLSLALVGVGLVGCGRFASEQREAWRQQAEEACLSSKLVQPTAYMSRVSEIEGPGSCGISYPFRASALAGGSVGLTNKLTLGCPIIPTIDSWLDGTVQPAAEIYFGTTVADIRAGSYSCRPRNNQRGAKVSEHAYGNAIDVMSFKLADGREITVKGGWRGRQDEQDFLREVFVGACRQFATVLGPGSDAFHYDHFHLDLARHNPRGDRHVCRPTIKFEPRLDPDRVAQRSAPRPRPTLRATEPPLEIEDDDEDPYAVSASSAPRVAAAPPPRSVPPVPTYSAAPLGSASRNVAPPRLGEPIGPPLALQPHLSTGGGIY